jgi:nucleotide-binding universal stress UspA family protein
MNALFNKLALAITFSPTGKALLQETYRLKNLFNSKLLFIHVGEKDSDLENQLYKIIDDAGYLKSDYEIAWTSGDTANSIIRECEKKNVDLLISGALEKETLVKYYLGSVARKLMRKAPCSTLILKSPSLTPKKFNSFCVSTDYSIESEKAIRTAYSFALLEKAEQLNLVRDYNIPGLATAIIDSGSMDEVEKEKSVWQEEEEQKMKLYIRELNLKELKINYCILYGKEGWESNKYVRENEFDLFVMSAPVKKSTFFDRLFPHEEQYSFENLPSNLLIVR